MDGETIFYWVLVSIIIGYTIIKTLDDDSLA